MGEYLASLRKLIGNQKIFHPGARVIIENSKGEILLIRRSDNDKWGLIAGGLEPGETIRECIIREAKEETGLTLKSVEGIGISTRPEIETVTYPNGDVTQYFTVVFYTHDWEGELAEKTEEAKEIRFFAMHQLPILPTNEAPAINWLEVFKRTGKFIID